MGQQNFSPSSQQSGSKGVKPFWPVVLLVLVVALIGVLAWQRNNANQISDALQKQIISLQNQIAKLQNKSQSPTNGAVATSSNETAGWKTYRNEHYGFEIKYPLGWALSEAFTDILSGKKSSQPFVVLGNPLSGPKVYSLYIFLSDNPKQLSLKEYVEDFIKRAQQEPVGALIFDKLTETTIGNIKAIELYNVFAYEQGNEQIYITNGDKIFEFIFAIAAENSNLNNPIENNATAHKILSTFKFTK